MPFPEGDDAWLIVASRNGAAAHPAWLYNLAAHPDQVEIEFERRKTAVTPQTLTGEERAAAWERITRERPNFAGYEEKTDRGSGRASRRPLNPHPRLSVLSKPRAPDPSDRAGRSYSRTRQNRSAAGSCP